MTNEGIANRTSHFVEAHCAGLVGLELAPCSEALDLGAKSMMELNTLCGLLLDRTVASVEFALESKEIEVDAFEM